MKVETIGIVYPKPKSLVAYQSYGDHWYDAATLLFGSETVLTFSDDDGKIIWGKVCNAEVDFLLFIENLPQWFELGIDININGIRVPKVLYCWDSHLHYFTYLQSMMNHFDKVFMASRVDAERLGAEWMPPAYNELLHRPLGLMKKWDIGFIGQQDNVIRRLPGMMTRLEALEDLQYRFREKVFIGQRYYGENYVGIMNECRCMFDWPTNASVGTRFYEALGMGIPIISPVCFEEREHSELVYPVNTIVSLPSSTSCFGESLMVSIIRDERKLDEIVQQQVDFCKKFRPTYKHRLEEMCNKIEIDSHKEKDLVSMSANEKCVVDIERVLDKNRCLMDASQYIDNKLCGKSLGVVIPTQFAIPTINGLVANLIATAKRLGVSVKICVVGPSKPSDSNRVSDRFADSYFPDDPDGNVVYCSSLRNGEPVDDFTFRVNDGLEIVRNSDFILICNDDVVMAKDALENMLLVLADYQYDIVGPLSNCDYSWQHSYRTGLKGIGQGTDVEFGIGMDYINREFEERIMNSYSCDMLPEDAVNLSTEKREWVAGYFMLFRRDVLDTYGKLDESMKMVCSDEEYCGRLPEGRVGYCFNAFVFHYGAVTRKVEEGKNCVLYHEVDNSDKIRCSNLAKRRSYLVDKRRSATVVFYAGPSWEKWSLDNLKVGGIGGSESCQLYLAYELSKLGYNVEMYYDWSGIKSGWAKDYRWEEFDIAKLDNRAIAGENIVVIYVRTPRKIISDIDGLGSSRKIKMILWNHDVAYGDFSYKDLARTDMIVNLSPWHKDYWETVLEVNPNKIRIIGDGVDKRHRCDVKPSLIRMNTKADTMRLIYASSYDRGLDILLAILKKVGFPYKLDVYYGSHNLEKTIESLANSSSNAERNRGLQLGEWYKKLCDDIKSLGSSVELHSRVAEDELVAAFNDSDVFVYPTYFHETYCITALYAQLAGLHIISRPLAALATTLSHRANLIDGDVYDVSVQERYVSALEGLYAAGAYKARVPYEMRRNYIEQHRWGNIVKKWDYLIGELTIPR